MNEIDLLISTIKRQLKARGMTYRDLASGLGSGLGSGFGSGLGSGFLTGATSGLGGGVTGEGCFTSTLSGAATSALGAGGVGARGPSPGAPICPRMGEGVRLPPGAPSTRLIMTGGASSRTGGGLGQNHMSRKAARCRHRERTYEARRIQKPTSGHGQERFCRPWPELDRAVRR